MCRSRLDLSKPDALAYRSSRVSVEDSDELVMRIVEEVLVVRRTVVLTETVVALVNDGCKRRFTSREVVLQQHIRSESHRVLESDGTYLSEFFRTQASIHVHRGQCTGWPSQDVEAFSGRSIRAGEIIEDIPSVRCEHSF